MTPEMWRRVEQECSELRDSGPERRKARLDELRAADPELAATVERMLGAHGAGANPEFLRPVDETASKPTTPEPEALPVIKDFEVISRIGRGGMGTVYLARDIQLNRLVALKVLSTRPDDDAPIRSFRKEAQAVAKLHHPGIVQIYRYGEAGPSWYIAMEYIEGATLAGQLKDDTSAGGGGDGDKPRRPRPRTRRRSHAERRVLLQRDRIAAYARVLSEVADALDHAHQQGIIHRDVKPSNILIDREGHARLTDFGIARITGDATISHADHITGTYPYMSPEQARVRSISIDHRSDIFSLGVVLYEILTLERPFGDDLEEVLRRLDEGEPVPVRQSNPAVDRDLAVICHKAIEIRPEDRYQSAAHMAADLRCWLNHQPILAHPPTLRRRAIRWAGRHRLRVAGGSIVLLLAAVALLLAVMKYRRDEQLAWLRIDPSAAGVCTIRLQAVDPATLDLLPPSLDESINHERTLGVAPGHYRVTIVLTRPAAPDPVFGEIDLLLTSPGKSAVTNVIATTSTTPVPSGGALVARLLSAADAAKAPPRPMVTVDAATYDLGLGEIGPVLQRRTLSLDTFLLDRTEVSNADYLAFLRATAAGPEVLQRLDAIADGRHADLDRSDETRERHHHPHTPQYWKTSGYDKALADRPVVGLRIQDAAAYAHWAGKRLPTMFELEAAARGPADPTVQPRPEYPAGLDLTRTYTDCDILRTDQSAREADHVDVYVRCSVPVDSVDPFPSPCGALHLYDNVREITSTVDLRNLDGVAKGRCWLDEPKHSKFGAAWTYPLTAWYYDRGFRCAKSAAPVTPLP